MLTTFSGESDTMSHVTTRLPHGLEDYATIARRRGSALEVTALRTRSRALRELLAYLASNGTKTFAEIASGHEPSDWHPRWAASLGRVVGLQALDETDVDLAIDLLRHGAELSEKSRLRYLRLRTELLFRERRFTEVQAALTSDPTLSADGYDYLLADLLNPFIDSPFADESTWLESFARRFADGGVQPPELRGDAEHPFDRLRGTNSPGSVTGGPLISVIMTTFQPDATALRTSVRSILNQTWADLELIIVDDASPDEFTPLLTDVAAEDRRVRLHRVPENGGTYLARNAGISMARGEYVTGQDDDDWSHPERLERQAAALGAGAAATQSWSIRIGNDLVFQRPGYEPARLNESSLMTRRSDLQSLGGYLPARKGADTELKTRFEAAFGPVTVLPDLLAVIRFEPTSLSRSDFGPGWRHPARHALRDAYMYWHDHAPQAELKLEADRRTAPIPIPRRFAVAPQTCRFDVVLAGDWRSYGGPQKSMIEEIHALTAQGLSVGILHLEAARFMTVKDQRLCDPIRELLARGIVQRVLADDPHSVRLLVLRYPPILQFPTFEPTTLDVERVVILANQAPSERDGSDVRYDVETVAQNARRLFGRRALWVPQGPAVRETIEAALPKGELTPFDLPGILDVDEWLTERASNRSERPVIGRHSRDNLMKWPADPATLTAVYPTDGSVEVRIMGGSEAVRQILGTRVPPSWVSFDADELPVRTFLNSLDFFVYYQHPQAYDAFGRAVVEALATGCVAVLPPHFEATFGDAAVYASEQDAMSVVSLLWNDRAAYKRQSDRALQVVRMRFSPETYAGKIGELLTLGPDEFCERASGAV